MKKSPSPADSKNIFTQYKVFGFSCGIGIITAGAVLFICAGVLSAVDVPHSAVVPMSLLAPVIGCLLAGFICARILRSGGLICGLICGSLIFLVALAAELLVVGGEVGLLALYKYIADIASAMIGGVLGVNKKRKVH